jgi:hypothetical protein
MVELERTENLDKASVSELSQPAISRRVSSRLRYRFRKGR